MKIIADSHIPYLEPLSSIADVITMDADDITSDAVADADALLTRTRTRCDAALLAGSGVSFVGTATIGTDHIDLDWCRSAGITVANAPGCNAPAVAQYVFASLCALANRPLRSYSIGIVGVGHVGSIVERWARGLGMRVLLNDPPRQLAEGGDMWSSLDDIARRADIITFHTPLSRDCRFPTWHLADEQFFNSLRRAPIVINAARGPVVDNAAWLQAIRAGVTGPAVIDCWEGEPHIDTALLDEAAIATPHIAGYSADGKLRASSMIIDALCRHFSLPCPPLSRRPRPVPDSVSLSAVMRSYDPLADTCALRHSPDAFEALRDHYDLRAEV